jgi:hypothetical protein
LPKRVGRALDPRQLIGERLGQRRDLLTLPGEQAAVGAAIDKAQLELGFKRLNATRDRRDGNTTPFRRPTQRASTANGDEIVEIAGIKHRAVLRISKSDLQYRTFIETPPRLNTGSATQEPAMKRLFLAAAIAITPVPIHAEDAPVATSVVIKTPPGVTRAMIEGGFKQAVPTYQAIPGLIRKYFTVNSDGFGGIYLWKNRAAAEAWFTPAWRAKAKATYGTDPSLTYFDAPVLIDNSAGQ